MQQLASTLIVVGILIVLIGLVWLIAPAVPWRGRLPGDIVIERENLQICFPLAMCILPSLVLTGIIWAIRFFSP